MLASKAPTADDQAVDVVVEVGGWEHACCGPAIELVQVVELGCLRTTNAVGQATLTETHHHLEPELWVRGRVHDIQLLEAEHGALSIQRLPSGRALRGFDPDDDGQLREAWTEVLLPPAEDFLVVVRLSAAAVR